MTDDKTQGSEQAESDNVYDIHGNVIDVGTTVRYVRTGTVGRVKELLIIDDEEWALLPSLDIGSDIDLMYNIKYLEVVEAKTTKKERALKKDVQELEKEKSQNAAVSMSEMSAPGGAG